jgi:hypothetical protein
MIPQGVQVFVALEPVDMRYSFDRLSGLAKEQVGYDARSGALFLGSSAEYMGGKTACWHGARHAARIAGSC